MENELNINNKERVIAFVHEVFPCGGAERITIDIASYLSSLGYKVYIFCYSFIEEKVPVDIPFCCDIIELPENKINKSLKDAEVINQQIKEKQIGVFIDVGCNMQYKKQILKDVPCKYVYAHHGVPFWEETARILGKQRKFTGGWPITHRLRWYILGWPKYVAAGVMKKRVLRMYQDIYTSVDVVTVLCDAYKDKLITGLQLQNDTKSGEKIYVIPNSERAVPTISYEKKKQILFMGRMSFADKRVDRLLLIWKKISNWIPDWELVLVGSGPEEERLRLMAQKLHLERTTFKGFSNNVREYYKDAAILCLTSTFEGWPLCLTEAQANAVVPVAFDSVAGIHQILSPSGKNGILVTPFDLDEFAEQLLWLTQHPTELKQMSHNVVEKSKDYSVEVIGHKWFQLFEHLYQQL